MRKALGWVLGAACLLVGKGLCAEVVEGLPLHVQKLDPAAVRIWVGDSVSTAATVAIATRKGIVVVDTVGIPKVDAQFRRIIAKELGRKDFAVLVNTHEHRDHTGGNAVYADCRIVGHERVAAGIAANLADRDRAVGWMEESLAKMAVEAEEEPSGTPGAERLREQMTFQRLNCEALRADARPVCPTEAFANRLTIDMGDATLKLYYVGGMHSASDIALLVPELGLLLTGDTMADVWLTDTPGCLASFSARPGTPHDFPLWLENWDLILGEKPRIRRIVTGHWNGELTLRGAEERVNYVRTLWEGIRRADGEGKSLEEIQAEYRLETRFPDLAGSPGFTPQNHASTLFEMWTAATRQESAAERLYALIDAGASEAEVRQVLAARGAKPPRYYFLENQINGYGYRFLQAAEAGKAQRMFRANAELFPGSWNVYDSLGEALLAGGDSAAAREMYEKSVALNPGNKNGLDALERIRASGGTD